MQLSLSEDILREKIAVGNPYVNRIKVYRLLAYMRINLPDMSSYWGNPEQTTIIPSAITSITYIDSDYAIIRYDEQTYKIYRADFDKMFEIEVL